uniref:Crystallin beta B3 n=2 Tax=Latimeria chalumnae TaxID=7897 RepID=H3AUW4_LATCH
MGTVRRSLQEALNLVTTAVTHERSGSESAGRNPFKRTSSFRHFASRSRESFRRFSVRSQQRFSSLRKRHTGPEPPDPDQLKQCVFRPSSEVKDTDTLVPEAGYPYGTWDASLQSEESFTPGTNDTTVSPTTSSKKQTPQSRLSSQTESTPTNDHHDSMRNPRTSSLDHSSVELDSTDGTEGVLSASASAYADGEAADFSFLDQTSVLDSSALKTRAQLSKRRSRRAPTSKSIRKSKLIVVEEDDNSWMFKDSTESKPVKQEDSDEEEKPKKSERSPAIQPQGLPMFPGMDPLALKAQLRKRPESDSPTEATASQLSKSPKLSFPQGAAGCRVLPPTATKEEGSEEAHPQWLKDLKSKKRQSQYENRP